MNILLIIVKEIKHRKLQFGLAVFSVLIATSSLVVVLHLLREHEIKNQTILAKKEADLEERITKINNDVRDAMLKLGFNIKIISKEQDLGDWHVQEKISKYMPEEYINHLIKSDVETIEHIIPCLRQKIKWPETKWNILLVGLGDKTVNPSAYPENIPFESIPAGSVILGHEIQRSLGFFIGQKITVMKRDFTVYKLYPERGSKDDITIWMNLEDIQALLGQERMINEIWALETQSAWSDISKVRKEISSILPETQVVEISDIASAKTSARTKVIEEGKTSIKQERIHQSRLKRTRVLLAGTLVPLAFLLCAAWLGLLSFKNVQDRKNEIGILLSLGYNRSKILNVFLFRSFAFAFVGGCLAVLFTGLLLKPDYRLQLIGMLAAIAIALIASCGPAVVASKQEPADVLRGD